MSSMEEMDVWGSFLTYSRVSSSDTSSLIFVTKSCKNKLVTSLLASSWGKDSMKINNQVKRLETLKIHIN